MKIVYALIDPVTGETRYVGKSVRGFRRIPEHAREAATNKTQTHSARWVRSLLRRGLMYRVHLLEVVPVAEDLDAAEKLWIRVLREHGHPLTNHADGGGGPLGVHPSAATRQRMSLAKKGRRLSTGNKLHITAALQGQQMSDERRARISKAARRSWASGQRRPSPKRRPLSQEHRALLALRMREWHASPAGQALTARSLEAARRVAYLPEVIERRAAKRRGLNTSR